MNATYKAPLFVVLTYTAVPTFADDVVINGAVLDASTKTALEDYYRVRIPPGRYWYDPISGVWGLEGGPGQGQILPNLQLGGTLRTNASNGTTGVFVNGRQLHQLDVAAHTLYRLARVQAERDHRRSHVDKASMYRYP